jgi:hypothetical protein
LIYEIYIKNEKFGILENVVKYDEEHCILKLENELALLNLKT